MSENGKNVMKTIQQMVQLCIEIGNFLKSFERLAVKKKYKPTASNKGVIKDTSTSYNEAQDWLPGWMYRIYQNDKNENEIMTLNIALHNPDDADRIDEPLVLVSKILFLDKSRHGEWDPWELYFHGGIWEKEKNKVYTQKEVILKKQKEIVDNWKKEDLDSFKQFSFIAVPLLEIEDEKAIERKILKPLAL